MADPTIFEYQLEDDGGLKSRTHAYVAYNGATLVVNDLINNWIALGDRVDGCTDARIVEGRITIPLAPDGAWKAAATTPGNNVNQVMTVNFENDFNRYLTPLLIPAYSEALLTAELQPDLADPNLAALITDMLAGVPTGVPTTFPNSRGLHQLDAVREAFLTTRKVRQNKAKTVVIP